MSIWFPSWVATEEKIVRRYLLAGFWRTLVASGRQEKRRAQRCSCVSPLPRVHGNSRGAVVAAGGHKDRLHREKNKTNYNPAMTKPCGIYCETGPRHEFHDQILLSSGSLCPEYLASRLLQCLDMMVSFFFRNIELTIWIEAPIYVKLPIPGITRRRCCTLPPTNGAPPCAFFLLVLNEVSTCRLQIE